MAEYDLALREPQRDRPQLVQNACLENDGMAPDRGMEREYLLMAEK